jgi:hypothetical protein
MPQTDEHTHYEAVDVDDFEPEEDEEVFDDELEDDVELDVVDDEALEVDADDDDDNDDKDGDESDDESGEEADEALDELEAEELELVDDEASESLLVDEVAELRAIRREELTLNVEAQAIRSGEFVCQSCFLVKRSSQLANRKKMICADCAA